MNERTVKLRSRVETLERELKEAREELSQLVQRCNHHWSEPVADHIHQDAYTIPGDPPGTMGVDWRGPCHVDAKTIKRWKRSCKICGEVQHTSAVTQSISEHPLF